MGNYDDFGPFCIDGTVWQHLGVTIGSFFKTILVHSFESSLLQRPK